MIGFLDLEFNSDTQVKRNRTVFDIIEISFITDDNSSILNTYCKPVANNGLLFNRVIELTGISQEQVNDGMTIDEALSCLCALCEDAEKVYTWGSYDCLVLEKNVKYCKNKDKIYGLKNKIFDLGELIKSELGLKNSISLLNIAIILGVAIPTHHSAQGDCELLKKIYENKNNPNQSLLDEFKLLDMKRNYKQRIVFEGNHFILTDSLFYI
jgi:DNA polymerase III alpha subunit (gram-positive type)